MLLHYCTCQSTFTYHLWTKLFFFHCKIISFLVTEMNIIPMQRSLHHHKEKHDRFVIFGIIYVKEGNISDRAHRNRELPRRDSFCLHPVIWKLSWWQVRLWRDPWSAYFGGIKLFRVAKCHGYGRYIRVKHWKVGVNFGLEDLLRVKDLTFLWAVSIL